LRAVLDPNVVISGLLSARGAPATVLSSWREGHFEVIVSPLLLAELRRARAYPKLRRRISAEEAELAVRWLGDGATHVDDPAEDVPLHSADPGDDYLIALAAHEKAALVSGDKHLLDLRSRLPVYAPRDFLELLADR